MNDGRPDVVSFALRDHKITRFLLAPDHPSNKGRAQFFLAFGFRMDAPELLARALLAHPHAAQAFRHQTGLVSERRLIYDGPLDCPDGRRANLRTV